MLFCNVLRTINAFLLNFFRTESAPGRRLKHKLQDLEGELKVASEVQKAAVDV